MSNGERIKIKVVKWIDLLYQDKVHAWKIILAEYLHVVSKQDEQLEIEIDVQPTTTDYKDKVKITDCIDFVFDWQHIVHSIARISRLVENWWYLSGLKQHQDHYFDDGTKQ